MKEGSSGLATFRERGEQVNAHLSRVLFGFYGTG